MELKICKKKLLLCSLVTLLLLLHSCRGQLTPVSCGSSGHVVLGASFSLQDGVSEATTERNCSFWTMSTSMSGEAIATQSDEEWTQEGSEYTFFSTGNYTYSCGLEDSGNLTVVSSQYTISLCRNCNDRRDQFRVTAGDSVQWVVVPDREEEFDLLAGCTMELQEYSGSEVLRTFLPDVTRHVFEEVGRFQLSCREDEDITASITVVEREGVDDKKHLHPLLYAHVAAMAAAFGILFPLAAFLYYHGVSLGYKVLLPVAVVLAVCGVVVVAVFIELTSGKHFQFFIHGVVGVALLVLAVLVMPLLLLHKKLRIYHFRLGHIVAFFGMGNILLGLTILPTSLVVLIALCVVYGLWLVTVVAFYVLYPAKKRESSEKKRNIDCTSLEMKPKNGTAITASSTAMTDFRKASCSSETSRGPQPLTKNIISEEKMIQLRKKSMDFVEAQKHMRELNAELGLKHQLARELDDFEDEGFKVRMERKDSNLDSCDDDEQADDEQADDSRAPLHQSSPELEDPFPSLDRAHYKRQPSTSDEDEDEGEGRESYQEFLQKRVLRSSSPINRACTFNYGAKKTRELEGNVDSDNSERGGSLRITRHSKRARGKMEHIFKKPEMSIVLDGSPPPLQPSVNVTPSTPPLGHALYNYLGTTETTDSASAQGTGFGEASLGATNPPPVQPGARNPPGSRKRRTGGLVPPLLMGPNPSSTLGEPVQGCPFHNSLASSRSKSPSPKPCRRGVSPGGVAMGGAKAGASGESPKPVRKKKVSVAQIEATFAPPTPVNLQPPEHISLSRSPSFDNARTHQDAFADNAFRSIMQISLDAICCANSVGDIVFWSAGACKMFGYTPGEAIGSSLEMIIPQSYKEKHRKGISARTDRTLKYIQKHNYTPEEQKHARLYAVHGVTKGGHEFPVEVNVTSFVIDGEMFYTGVISEAKPSRSNSVSSSNDLNEVALKQRALAVGAQMKIAHKLRSAEQMSQRELERVLKGSLGTNFEVDAYQFEQMINGIMKAGDPNDTGSITFIGLIQLLSKHQLYISESGLIARYGKTKSSTDGPTTQNQRRSPLASRLQEFLHRNMYTFIWIMLYIALNLLLFAVGVGVYSRRDDLDGTWSLWAFGTGPVLSMNCVFILLPTLSSLVHAMRNSCWMNKIFPLKRPVLFHLVVVVCLLFWTGVHLLTHLCSFGLDSTLYDHFGDGIRTNIFPTVTGFAVLMVVAVMALSSVTFLRARVRFIPFKVLHWVGSGLFYLLLLVHGVHYWNPSFWKWLLPVLVIFVLERVYKHRIVHKVKVNIKSAGRYDTVSRTAIVELEKPKRFEYEPGQYILLNLPKIGKFEWQACPLSSGPKEDKLTIHIPFSDDIWFKKAFEYLKQNPHNMVQPVTSTRGGPGREKNRLSQIDVGIDPASQLPAFFTGPYGPVDSSKVLFKYNVSTVVCGGDREGPPMAKAFIKKFLDYRKAVNCHCGCQPMLSKLYFVWVIPSGNDFEWFTDYLSDLCEDEHLHRYLDIRVFLTNCDSAPDELASALLQLGLKTAGDKVTVRRPSQPQLNNLYHMTSYGVPDFTSLLDYISARHTALWMDKPKQEFGVFTVGELKYTMHRELTSAISKSSKPGQLQFKEHRILS